MNVHAVSLKIAVQMIMITITKTKNTLCKSYYYIPSPLSVHFPMTHSVRYQPIFNGLKFMLHRACVLNNVVITTVIEMVEILDGRVGKHSVERVRYVINNWSL